MKKLIALCLTVVLLLVAVPVIGASAVTEPTFKVSTDVENAAAGETVTVKLSVENNPGLNGFTVDIGYNSDVMKVLSVQAGSFSGIAYSPLTRNPFRATWVDTLNLPNQTSDVLTLKFEIKDGALLGNTDITVEPLSVYYNDGIDPDNAVPGTMTDVVCKKSNASIEIVCRHGETEIRDKIDATCASNGYTGDKVCKLCNAVLERGTVIPATGEHTGADWEFDAERHWHVCENCDTEFGKDTHKGGEATCIKQKICEVCGQPYGAFDNSNHKNVVIKNAREATCNDEGYTGDKYCEDCESFFERGETIPKKAHTPANIWSHDETFHWKDCSIGCGTRLEQGRHEGGEATCSKLKVCEVCGEEYGAYDSDNHKNIVIKDAVAATEEKEGYTGDKYCEDCERIIEEGTLTEKLEHNPVLVEAKEATLEEDGNIKYYHCESCDKYYAVASDGGIGEEITKADTVVAKLTPKGDTNGDTKGDTKGDTTIGKTDETGKTTDTESSPKTADSTNVFGIMTAIIALAALCSTAIVYKKKAR